MKFKAIVILVLYLIATLAIELLLVRVWSEKLTAWTSITISVLASYASAMTWVWLSWPVCCLLCLLLVQLSTMPFLLRSRSATPT